MTTNTLLIWYTLYLTSLGHYTFYFHSVAKKLNFIRILKKYANLLAQFFWNFVHIFGISKFWRCPWTSCPSAPPPLTSDDRLKRRWCVPFNSWVVYPRNMNYWFTLLKEHPPRVHYAAQTKPRGDRAFFQPNKWQQQRMLLLQECIPVLCTCMRKFQNFCRCFNK